MFKSLSGKNWEAWKEVKLDFTSGINVIIPADENNPNDVGKTGLMRLLYWICENKPSGAQFFSDYAGKKGVTEGCLVLNNNKKIKQEKTIRINKNGEKVVVPDTSKYYIDKKDFGAYGQDVPDEITRELNLSELNFQKQDDPLFIVNDSGGQIAKTINRITKQEEADQWIKELTTDINSENKEIKILKEDIADLNSKIKKLSGLEKLEDLIAKFVSLENKEIKIEEKYDRIFELRNILELTQLEIKENNKKILKLEELIKEIEVLFEKEQKLKQEEKEINDNIKLINTFIEIQEEKEILMTAVSIEDSLKQLENLYLKENKLEKQINKINEYKDIHTEIISLNSMKNDTKKQYAEKLKKEKVCPVCFGKIDDKCINKILKEL